MVGFLASRISRKIVEPLNQLDLEHPENNESYDELAPLLSKISLQQKTIHQQLQQAKQREQELSTKMCIRDRINVVLNVFIKNKKEGA